MNIKENIKFILSVLLIVFIFRYFIAQPFIVEGSSMEPTFETGQYLIVDELSYFFENPHRGEVIVFRPPQNTSTHYIKRVIGLPGETVTISGSYVYIKNASHPEGFKLDESYIVHKKDSNMAITLKDDEYFVMGDNRANSSDSRYWGPIHKSAISGRTFVRLFPFNVMSLFPGKIVLSSQ